MAPNLSARETELLAIYAISTITADVNWDKFVTLADLKDQKSAKTTWAAIKKKLNAGAGDDLYTKKPAAKNAGRPVTAAKPEGKDEDNDKAPKPTSHGKNKRGNSDDEIGPRSKRNKGKTGEHEKEELQEAISTDFNTIVGAAQVKKEDRAAGFDEEGFF